MAQQSAMNQMINHLEEMKSKTTDQSEIYMLTIAWVKAIHLIQIEKEQIEKAYYTGQESKYIGGEYYNETYNK